MRRYPMGFTRSVDTAKLIGKNALFFAIAKGVAFLAPIFFVKIVSIEQYGLVEYSYAAGSIIATIIALGLTGAYPYFILKKGEKEKESAFYLYGGFVGLLFVVSAVAHYTKVLDVRYYLVILFACIFVLQRIYSSILKCHDKGYLGVMYDSGYYFLLSAVILAGVFLSLQQPLGFLVHLMGLYAVALVVLYLVKYRRTAYKSAKKVILEDYPVILKYSLHLVVSGFIIYWLTSSPRIYIKFFMGYEQVGVYSFYFRLAGISVALYQFLYIAFFKKLYLSDARRLDNYYVLIMGAVLVCSLAVYALSPLYIDFFLPQGTPLDGKLFLLLCGQMTLWVGISFCEGIIARENSVKWMNVVLAVIVCLFPVCLLLVRGSLTLTLFTYMMTVMFAAAYAAQIYILHKKSITLRRCFVFNIFIFASSSLIYWLF